MNFGVSRRPSGKARKRSNIQYLSSFRNTARRDESASKNRELLFREPLAGASSCQRKPASKETVTAVELDCGLRNDETVGRRKSIQCAYRDYESAEWMILYKIIKPRFSGNSIPECRNRYRPRPRHLHIDSIQSGDQFPQALLHDIHSLLQQLLLNGERC